MIFLFDEGLAEQSSCLKDQEHFHRSLTLCVCKRAGLVQPVCPREGAHSDKGSPAGAFHGVWGWTWFSADIFSCVMCAAVRNKGMCSLPFTVTGVVQPFLWKKIWPNVNPEYCNKTPTERRERRENRCQVGISKQERLILQSLMRAEKPCFWDLSRFHE